MSSNHESIRPLTADDTAAIERLLGTSEYIYQRFTAEELPRQLKSYPAVGLFSGNSLQAFLLSQVLSISSTWLSGFGVSWTASSHYLTILDQLLDQLSLLLTRRGVRFLHYSGNDASNDWLRTALLGRGFIPYRQLYAYDKYNYDIPTSGNRQVSIRRVNLPAERAEGLPSDMAALMAIEEACFEDVWRYDSQAFSEIATTHPYFVVAELNGQVVGYQFNTLDADMGYLIRIAVHPSVNGQGIGARLMAEAVGFFAQARVSRIMLNTQEDNIHAHRLYEWFGFVRLPQTGFVLRKAL